MKLNYLIPALLAASIVSGTVLSSDASARPQHDGGGPKAGYSVGYQYQGGGHNKGGGYRHKGREYRHNSGYYRNKPGHRYYDDRRDYRSRGHNGGGYNSSSFFFKVDNIYR